MANINPRREALEHAMYLAGMGPSANTIACVFEKGGIYIVSLFKALSLGGPDLCPRRVTEEKEVCSSEVAKALLTLSRTRTEPTPPIFLHKIGRDRWPFEWQLVDDKLAPLLIGGISIVAGYYPI